MYVQALELARKASEQAARAAARQFGNWLQDGPSAGLKRQHQLSRTAVGWIPTAVAAVETIEHEAELDEADLPEVAEAARLQRSLLAPLSMQQSAEAERQKWAVEWAAGQHFAQPVWEGGNLDLATPPPQLLFWKPLSGLFLLSRAARASAGTRCTLGLLPDCRQASSMRSCSYWPCARRQGDGPRLFSWSSSCCLQRRMADSGRSASCRHCPEYG